MWTLPKSCFAPPARNPNRPRQPPSQSKEEKIWTSYDAVHILRSWVRRCLLQARCAMWVWSEDKEKLTPSEIGLSPRPAPSWARGCPGTPTPGASGKAPGRGPTERIQEVSGTAAGSSGTGVPENQWCRVNSNPHVPHSACPCGNSRTGASLGCRRRETGAVVDHLLPIFSEDALEMSESPG